MQIIQNVIVKQVLTENSKFLLVDKYKEDILLLEKECSQLLFQQKQLQKKMEQEREAIHRKFQMEQSKRLEKMEQLRFVIEQINHLPLGSLIKEKEVQAIITVEIGDDWSKLIEKTIIIEDGKIKEII